MNAIAVAATLALAASGTAQNGGARCAPVAISGGTIVVTVSTNDTTVEVSAAGSAHVTSHDVGANREATIPVPNVPPGTILFISVGRGLRATILEVEVIAL